MAGWQPTWNPSSSAGCHLNPMYNEPGLGSGASYGSGYPTAAAVGQGMQGMQPSMALAGAMLLPDVQNKVKIVNSTPGHLVLGFHAFTLAAMQVEINAQMPLFHMPSR